VLGIAPNTLVPPSEDDVHRTCLQTRFLEHDTKWKYREVFRALASSGRALEINTKSPLASAELIGWWWQEGGNTVSFGSDAHDPYSVGSRFDLAVDIVEAAGFRPGRDRLDFWRR
jgi:histidinol-phosphatase (PHP family)